ncbi:MAG: hypothetical protein HY659_10285 [Rhizobiales bacterium]|nr:hypothetical protein [Hyphomicrobiales bacterium]
MASDWGRYAEPLEQVYRLIRNTKWFVALSLVITLALYIPGQLRELYRKIVATITQSFGPIDPFSVEPIASAWPGVFEAIRFFLPLVAIAVFISVGTRQVTTESLSLIPRPTRAVREVARVLPSLLGFLPLLFCGIAQLVAAPMQYTADALARIPVGSRWAGSDLTLAGDVREGLTISGIITLFLAVVFFLGVWRWNDATRRYAHRVNEFYFSNPRFLLLTVLLITVTTIAFLAAPVKLPQVIGSFSVLALFVLCVAAFSVHFSLLTINQRIPYLTIFLLPAVLWSLPDWNDNHAVRYVVDANAARVHAAASASARDQFEQWYKRRVDLAEYENNYPVYIVTAQGGGIYAAYQSAVFLARMQDYCPAFAHHLFAISSVSGGSVGAAAFVAALRQRARPASVDDKPTWLKNPCPRIAKFLGGETTAANSDLILPDGLEPDVRKILNSDFLSPLVAASLFPDFTQRFIPVAIGDFDRARALEYAIEDAFVAAFPASKQNAFKQSFLSMWDAGIDAPALLMNTTDAASGRRVLLSPFGLVPPSNDDCKDGKARHAGSTVHFQSLCQSQSAGPSVLDISLSTAAVMSARFPWVTPAATVPVNDSRFTGSNYLRLVDGGYVDNSGVETALDLISALATVESQIAARADEHLTFGDGKPYRRVSFHLIVLTGGDFPVRNSYALGETAEPLRALLSTRTSRAYVAIERAARELGPNHIKEVAVTAPRLKRIDLTNRYYDLPIGWAMAERTQYIIGRQSGQFLDCDPDVHFKPKLGKDAVDADCAQLLVYYELSRSLPAAAKYIEAAERLRRKGGDTKRDAEMRLDHEAVMRCYSKNVEIRNKVGWDIGPREADAFDKLLDVWDEHPHWKDDRWLAFIVGTVMYETGHLRYWHAPLAFPSAERIWAKFKKYLKNPEEARNFVNKPETLANRIYANRHGNGDENSRDGWRYRGRGMIQIFFRENYERFNKLVDNHGLSLVTEPDLALVPIVAARIVFSMATRPEGQSTLAKFFNAQNANEAGDWENARKAFLVDPANEGVFMLNLDEGVTETKKYGKFFLDCLKRPEAKRQSDALAAQQ